VNVGPFVTAAGSRAFRGAKEQLIFDLWRRNGSPDVFVLVRRFRIDSDPILVWTRHPPSESVPIGFMVPIDYWDDRVDETGVQLWTA
jgi:hypothetical protein